MLPAGTRGGWLAARLGVRNVVYRRSTLAFAAMALSLTCAAHAELGGGMTPLQADRGVMTPQSSMTTAALYSRHIVTAANGGNVNEFLNATGQVFAVTWSGPGKPDLRTLLGRYFAAITVDRAAAMHSPRQPLTINQPDLKIQTSGHMGWFNGVALVPSLAPVGFNPADLTVTG